MCASGRKSLLEATDEGAVSAGRANAGGWCESAAASFPMEEFRDRLAGQRQDNGNQSGAKSVPVSLLSH